MKPLFILGVIALTAILWLLDRWTRAASKPKVVRCDGGEQDEQEGLNRLAQAIYEMRLHERGWFDEIERKIHKNDTE